MRAPASGRPLTYSGPRPERSRPGRNLGRGALAGPNTEPDLLIPQRSDAFEAAPAPARAGAATSKPVLARGAIGTAVRQLQRALMKLGHLSSDGYASGPGVFGPRTEQALQAFQHQAGLPSTGQVDALTERALQQSLHR